MKVDILKLQNGDRASSSIWIGDNRDFEQNEFLKLIAPFGVSDQERVSISTSPAEFIDKITTKLGVFYISREFDEFSGTTIFSDNHELMDSIFEVMVTSGQFHAKV